MRILSKVCMRKDVGLNGNLFGGNMLAWMDEAAYIYTKRIASNKTLLTLKFDEILFKRPVKEGDIVDFYCCSEKFGNTSVTFNIRALLGTIEIKEVFSTKATFVAVDDNGVKMPIEQREYFLKG